jgi:hypothetical protein
VPEGTASKSRGDVMSNPRILRNHINGVVCDAADRRTADVLNPATGEVYATAPVSGPVDVDTAMAAAATAFETWRDTSPAQRQLALLRIADAIEEPSAAPGTTSPWRSTKDTCSSLEGSASLRSCLPEVLRECVSGTAVYACGPTGLLDALEAAQRQSPNTCLHVADAVRVEVDDRSAGTRSPA